VIGIPFPTDPRVLAALKRGGGWRAGDSSAFDATVLAFAAYRAARAKLAGTAAAAAKSRAAATDCGSQGGEFLISVTCAPTVANARKCAGLALAALRWGGLFQPYAAWCRALGVPPDRAAFAAAAAAANRAARGALSVVIAGRVAADAADAAKTARALAAKIPDAPPKGAGRRRRLPPGALGEPTPLLRRPAPGLAGAVVQAFADSAGRGPPSLLAGGVLFLPPAAATAARRAAGGGKPERHVQALLRLGGEARGAVVFRAAQGCRVPTRDLVAGGGLSARALLGAIRAALLGEK